MKTPDPVQSIERQLIDAYQMETQWEVRALLAQTLALNPSKAGAELLVSKLLVAQPQELMFIQQSLGKMGSHALPAMLRVLNATHRQEHQITLLNTLTHLNDPRVISYLDSWYDALLAAVPNEEGNDGSRDLRARLIGPLEQVGTNDLAVLPVLAKMLRDPWSTIRQEAAEALLAVMREAAFRREWVNGSAAKPVDRWAKMRAAGVEPSDVKPPEPPGPETPARDGGRSIFDVTRDMLDR